MTQEQQGMEADLGDFSYGTAVDMPPEIKDFTYKEWLPRVMAGALKAVSELPQEHRDHVLRAMSDACSPMAVGVCGIRPEWSKDEYLAHMTKLPPPLGPREIDWQGDVVEVSYHPPTDADGRPVCQCPLIMLGMAEPFPELCICSAHTGAAFVEAYTGEPRDRVELIGSIHSGMNCCQYRVHMKPSAGSEA